MRKFCLCAVVLHLLVGFFSTIINATRTLEQAPVVSTGAEDTEVPVSGPASYNYEDPIEVVAPTFVDNDPLSFFFNNTDLLNFDVSSPTPFVDGDGETIDISEDSGSSDAARSSGPSSAERHGEANYYRKENFVGWWGGTCTCPDGQTYEVGDLNDGCGKGPQSLACQFGTPSNCEKVSKWSRAGKMVTCVQKDIGYRGCYYDGIGGKRDLIGNWKSGGCCGPMGGYGVGAPTHQGQQEACRSICRKFKFFGLQWNKECFCGNTFGSQGPRPSWYCGNGGDRCAAGIPNACGNANAIYEVEPYTRFVGRWQYQPDRSERTLMVNEQVCKETSTTESIEHSLTIGQSTSFGMEVEGFSSNMEVSQSATKTAGKATTNSLQMCKGKKEGYKCDYGKMCAQNTRPYQWSTKVYKRFGGPIGFWGKGGTSEHEVADIPSCTFACVPTNINDKPKCPPEYCGNIACTCCNSNSWIDDNMSFGQKNKIPVC